MQRDKERAIKTGRTSEKRRVFYIPTAHLRQAGQGSRRWQLGCHPKTEPRPSQQVNTNKRNTNQTSPPHLNRAETSTYARAVAIRAAAATTPRQPTTASFFAVAPHLAATTRSASPIANWGPAFPATSRAAASQSRCRATTSASASTASRYHTVAIASPPAVTAGSAPAVTAGSPPAVTTDSPPAVTADSAPAVTAGSAPAVTAGSAPAVTAGSAPAV